MTRFLLFILLIISMMAGSCSGRKSKVSKRDLIPEKKMVSILSDIYLANGLLSLHSINNRYSMLDSVNAYIQIVEKHGYTKEKVDKTMEYYFFDDPKGLNKIYDQVLGKLSEKESLMAKEFTKIQVVTTKLWTGKDFYIIPSVNGDDSTRFDVLLIKSGYYTLSFSVTLYPDDQSVNPGPTAFMTPIDSIDSGKKVYVHYLNYLKDGRAHNYTLTFHVPDNKKLHLRGWLYDFDNTSSGQKKNIKIENISFTYSQPV
jgi:hypothetical protein